MVLDGTLLTQLLLFSVMFNRKYRRIIPTTKSKPQGYQLSLIAFLTTFSLTGLIFFIPIRLNALYYQRIKLLLFFILIDFIFLILLVRTWLQREETSIINIPLMSNKSKKLSRKLKQLFNDKMITDVLHLSNTTRYGEEMPEINVWINENLSEGYVAIENIANWERADREKFQQRVSSIFSGKYQRFAVVNSELTAGDSFIIFYFSYGTLYKKWLPINYCIRFILWNTSNIWIWNYH